MLLPAAEQLVGSSHVSILPQERQVVGTAHAVAWQTEGAQPLSAKQAKGRTNGIACSDGWPAGAGCHAVVYHKHVPGATQQRWSTAAGTWYSWCWAAGSPAAHATTVMLCVRINARVCVSSCIVSRVCHATCALHLCTALYCSYSVQRGWGTHSQVQHHLWHAADLEQVLFHR